MTSLEDLLLAAEEAEGSGPLVDLARLEQDLKPGSMIWVPAPSFWSRPCPWYVEYPTIFFVVLGSFLASRYILLWWSGY